MRVDAADKSALVLMLRPQSGLGQELKQSHLSIDPQMNLYEFHHAFGNLQQRTMLGQGGSNNYQHLHGRIARCDRLGTGGRLPRRKGLVAIG
jgi:hypothetical protein